MKTFTKIIIGSAIGCIVATVIGWLILAGIIGSIPTSSETAVGAPTRPTILKIDFKEAVAEQQTETFNLDPLGSSLSFDEAVSLYDYISAIDKAATDPNVSLIFITPDQPMLSLTQAEEIREALVRFRQSGKPVISYSNVFTNGSIYLATAADRVLFNTAGDVYVNGLSTHIFYLKDLLDKVGVEVQLIRHGKFKSAGEPFIANSMSEANYEQNKSMIDAIWKVMADDIAASRGIDGKEFNKWVDDLALVDAESLLDRGLVDELCFESEAVDYLCTLSGASSPAQLRFMDVANYAKAVKTRNGRSRNRIAIVYCNGELVMEEEGFNDRFGGVETARILARLRRDDNVKAVILRVNSPGGSAQAGELINHEIGLLREVKPVIASFGDYAASGGYWISARANRIFTRKTTLTGSIGVFSMIPCFGGALKSKLGINVESVGSNRHSTALTPFSPLDEEERAFASSAVEKIYDKFIGIVSEGRGMKVEEVDSLAQGRVWTGIQALDNGLADEIGGLHEAIAYAEIAASLTGGYSIVEYPEPLTLMDELMAGLAATDGIENPYVKAIGHSYSHLKNASGAFYCARLPYIYKFK